MARAAWMLRGRISLYSRRPSRSSRARKSAGIFSGRLPSRRRRVSSSENSSPAWDQFRTDLFSGHHLAMQAADDGVMPGGIRPRRKGIGSFVQKRQAAMGAEQEILFLDRARRAEAPAGPTSGARVHQPGRPPGIFFPGKIRPECHKPVKAAQASHITDVVPAVNAQAAPDGQQLQGKRRPDHPAAGAFQAFFQKPFRFLVDAVLVGWRHDQGDGFDGQVEDEADDRLGRGDDDQGADFRRGVIEGSPEIQETLPVELLGEFAPAVPLLDFVYQLGRMIGRDGPGAASMPGQFLDKAVHRRVLRLFFRSGGEADRPGRPQGPSVNGPGIVALMSGELPKRRLGPAAAGLRSFMNNPPSGAAIFRMPESGWSRIQES